MSSAPLATRPVFCTREGGHFRLSFPYSPSLVERVRELPYATFDGATKSWTALVCVESLERLRKMHYDGLVDVAPDTLIADGEQLARCAPALLRSGTRRRPFVVTMAWRDDTLYSRLRAVPGHAWDKRLQAITYPEGAGPALDELAQRGVLDDPDRLLRPADTVVAFDVRTGRFVVLGDARAQVAFDENFPVRDVMAAWADKGLDVAFADAFSAEVYASERARLGTGLQPTGLQVPLFDYQARSVAAAVERRGFGVFHAPGLGKTAIGVAAGHELLTNRRTVERVLIVCPSTVRTQWRNEIERFCGDTDIVLVEGSAAKRTAAYTAGADARWVIVHYDVLSRDLEKLTPLARGSYLICDEAHRLKTPTSKRSKAAHALGKVAAGRLALTGTPVESVPDEWYWVLSFAAPGSLGVYGDFCNRYMFPSRWGFEGSRNLDELRVRSAPHYIRFTKDQVATSLPPLRVQHLPIDPDPAYAAVLRRAHRDARDEIANERRQRAGGAANGVLDGAMFDEIEAGAEMTAVGVLRALCTSPRIVAESEAPAAVALRDAGVVPDSDGPKLDELRTRCAELQAAGERVVIFTWSKRMANLIAERFTGDGIRHVLYTGDTSTKDREVARSRFVDPDDDVCAFIATDAAAEGLNLGRCCSTLINVDIPWTPTRLEQRSNRIHRIDGTAPHYLVINMTVRGTIEEGILRMVEAKADLSDAIFGETGGRARTTGRRGPTRYLDSAIEEYFCAEDPPEPPAQDMAPIEEPDDAGPDDAGPDDAGPDDVGGDIEALDEHFGDEATGEGPTDTASPTLPGL
jgi:superfamily II DNA or RNA helicase